MFTRFMLMNEAGEGSGGGGFSESVESSDVSNDVGGEESSEVVEQELTPAEVKKIKQLKLKFNGKEIVEDLPFEIEESHADWLVKQRQKAMLADHKANEYSQLEREIGAFIQELRKNPKKALSNPAIGLDVKQFAAQILEEEIAQAQKTPEQIEREALQAELEEIKAERERERQEAEARNLEMLTERAYEQYDTQMSEALESSDLPKSPYVIKKMTEYMMLGIENGIDVSPKDIVPLIRQEIHADIQQMFQVMPVEVIEQVLGKDVTANLKKKKVAAPAKQAPIPVKKAVNDIAKPKEEKKAPEKKLTVRDFFGV